MLAAVDRLDVPQRRASCGRLPFNETLTQGTERRETSREKIR
jgi:hypothetical protein